VLKINNKQQKIITISSLLHDAGKLFVEDINKSFNYQDNLLNFIDTIDNENLLEIKNVLKDLYSSNQLDSDSLAFFIEKAHNLVGSSLKSDYSYNPLKNVFSNIDIGKDNSNQEKYYLPSKLSPENTYPVSNEKIKSSHLKATSSSFKEELKKILESPNSNNWTKNLYSLIEKYGWSYPESRKSQDTLVDHTHLITSIAVILYKSREENINENKNFKIIGGDLSGIQSYIYDIARINTGGVSKRLRARSFFVSILGQAILNQLLHELELPQASKIISAGGKFYLLAPNSDSTNEILEKTAYKINKWLYEEFQSELYFNFASVNFEGEKFNDFSLIYDSINEKLEANKSNKFINFLKDHESFQLDAQYGANADICDSCKKLWTEDGSELCHYCSQDLDLGRRLTEANYIGFKFEDTDNESYDFKLFNEDPVFISLLSNKISESNYDLVINIKDDNISPAVPEIIGTYSSYIPIFADKETKFNLCEKCKDENCLERETYYNDFPYLFSCLAASSVTDRDKGLQALGVLKADVDMLGSIFSIGLGTEQINFSQIVSLSRMTDYYFSKILPSNFSRGEKVSYSNCSANLDKNYIVYAGGDDLLILGPWDNLIATSFYINESFRNYTGNNDNVTISAGLALVKPKYPIAMSSKMATEEEVKAKESGRNAFSIFGESRKWKEWLDILPLANLLDNSIQEGYFSMSFVRRLNKYAAQEKLYQNNNDNEKRKWIAMFQYDLGRNFYDTIKIKKDPKIKESLDKLIELYLKEKNGMRGVENFKLPFHWSLYRNRD